MESILTKHQSKKFGPVHFTEHGKQYRLTAKARYDDQCGNGHNSFALTADIDVKRSGGWCEDSGGCCHEEIAKHFPALAPLIKWHLVSSDEPMHYIANAVYHADEHGPTHAWVYYTLPIPCDPLKLEGTGERLLGYLKADTAKEADGKEFYRVVWDEKTAKTRNLDHARSCAVWPDATDEELTAPGLAERLKARLPALMEEFHKAMTSDPLNFVF